MASKLHSWKQKFGILMTGQAVSIFTSSVIQMAIIWYLTDRTGLLPPSGIKVFIVLAFIMGITLPFYHGVLNSIYQIKIKGQYLGRVLSLTSSMTMFAMPFGLIFAGRFAEMTGVNRWFLISGILTVLISIISHMLPSLRKIT